MKRVIDLVMLVDDDEATNFYNRIMVEESTITNKIIVHDHANAALIDLKSKLSDSNIHSAILFLDLNMPLMNGWQFLEEVASFSDVQKNKLKIVMVSASEYPKDLEKMSNHPLIAAHMPKPLESEKIRMFAEKCFL